MTDEAKTARIRELNDELRTNGRALNGRVVVMGGLVNDSAEKRHQVFEAVAKFDDWTTGDDPYGEHDFGKVVVEGEAIIRKIDYYSLDEAHGSEHPEDQKTTIRVLTLRLLAKRLDALVEHANEVVEQLLVGHHIVDHVTDDLLGDICLNVAVAVPPQEQASSNPRCPLVALLESMGLPDGKHEIGREDVDLEDLFVVKVGLRAVEGTFKCRFIAKKEGFARSCDHTLVKPDHLVGGHPDRLDRHLARMSKISLSVSRSSSANASRSNTPRTG